LAGEAPVEAVVEEEDGGSDSEQEAADNGSAVGSERTGRAMAFADKQGKIDKGSGIWRAQALREREKKEGLSESVLCTLQSVIAQVCARVGVCVCVCVCV
jgi:hypothetical protein